MPLSEREQHRVDFACRYPGERYGGSWSTQEYLDNLNLSDPATPDFDPDSSLTGVG